MTCKRTNVVAVQECYIGVSTGRHSKKRTGNILLASKTSPEVILNFSEMELQVSPWREMYVVQHVVGAGPGVAVTVARVVEFVCVHDAVGVTVTFVWVQDAVGVTVTFVWVHDAVGVTVTFVAVQDAVGAPVA